MTVTFGDVATVDAARYLSILSWVVPLAFNNVSDNAIAQRTGSCRFDRESIIDDCDIQLKLVVSQQSMPRATFQFLAGLSHLHSTTYLTMRSLNVLAAAGSIENQ